ncbi:MAG: hypothetical protein QM840_06850 [Verrucomicrobiota bacterium]|nr:hypothetical protein [Verrucomicrobiota bacterium]
MLSAPFSITYSYQLAMYKGCTMDAHRVYKLKSYEHPMSIPCTPLVHGALAGVRDGDWEH